MRFFHCRRINVTFCWVIGSVVSLSTNELIAYTRARLIRASGGHDASINLYRDLLQANPDDMTASTRIAAGSGRRMEEVGLSIPDERSLTHLRDWLHASGFTSRQVKTLLNIIEPHSCAPIYITPALPGSVRCIPFVQPKLTSLQLIVSLFLLGLAIPKSRVNKSDAYYVSLMQDAGMIDPCFVDPSIWVPLVSMMPLDLVDHGTLLFVTDWHPSVLNTISIGNEHPVMYIGPDSLALVQHFLLDPLSSHHVTALDLCTGSGIQALVFCKLLSERSCVVADLNPRALRFTKLNAALNGLSSQIKTYKEVDLLADSNALIEGSRGQFDLVTANPPFLPLPESMRGRHSIFSVGGESGEAVLESVLRVSQEVLEQNGSLAIVSEFFLGKGNESDSLLYRLKQYWGGQGNGQLFTNERPISSAEYVKRRGDEDGLWKDHLAKMGLFACSPGLLYVKKTSGESKWKHTIVPRTEHLGSIWTPSNHEAVAFTREWRRK